MKAAVGTSIESSAPTGTTEIVGDKKAPASAQNDNRSFIMKYDGDTKGIDNDSSIDRVDKSDKKFDLKMAMVNERATLKNEVFSKGSWTKTGDFELKIIEFEGKQVEVFRKETGNEAKPFEYYTKTDHPFINLLFDPPPTT